MNVAAITSKQWVIQKNCKINLITGQDTVVVVVFLKSKLLKQSTKGLYLRGMSIHDIKINWNPTVNGYLIIIGCIDSSLCSKQCWHLHIKDCYLMNIINVVSQAGASEIQSVI